MEDFDRYSYILNGRVVVFYPEDQTADIKICVERQFSNSQNSRSLKPREILLKVPCQTPSGGGWSMTMPITEGDTCILFFNQVGYDHWLFEDKDEGGMVAGDPVPHLDRHFDENDGYALVGLNTIPRAIKDYHATNSEWRGPDSALQVIRLKPDHHIEIESSVQVTVVAPSVLVQCDDAVVEATTVDVLASDSASLTCATAEVAATTSATVTAPILDLECANEINATTPLLNLSGNLVVGGTIASGAIASGAITAPSMNGVIVETHTHTTVKVGDPTSPPLP